MAADRSAAGPAQAVAGQRQAGARVGRVQVAGGRPLQHGQHRQQPGLPGAGQLGRGQRLPRGRRRPDRRQPDVRLASDSGPATAVRPVPPGERAAAALRAERGRPAHGTRPDHCLYRDTGPSPALAGLGRTAALLIADATSRDQQHETGQGAVALNLTAAQAGQAAAEAGAAALLLTHFWPGNDREASRADAVREFGGEVLLADEGTVIALP